MRTTVLLERSPSDRRLPRQILVPVGNVRHRPVERFRLRLRSREDVETARRCGAPLYLVEPWISEALGYPLSFRPRLIVAREWVPTISESGYPLLPFHDSSAARNPLLEDLVVALLRIDPLGARRVVRENRRWVNDRRLVQRVYREGVEGEAAEVRLDDFVPGLPSAPRRLSRRELNDEDKKEYARGLRL